MNLHEIRLPNSNEIRTRLILRKKFSRYYEKGKMDRVKLCITGNF